MRLLKLATAAVGGGDHLFAAEARSPSSRCSDRPFAGHSRPTWIVRRGHAHLRAEVEVAPPAFGERRHALCARLAHADPCPRGPPICALGGVAPPLPRHELAA